MTTLSTTQIAVAKILSQIDELTALHGTNSPQVVAYVSQTVSQLTKLKRIQELETEIAALNESIHQEMKELDEVK